MKQLLFYILFSVSIVSCSESKSGDATASTNSQETDVREAIKELKDSLSIFKSQYVKLYEARLVSSTTTDSLKSDLQTFNTVFQNTSAYIDSLWSYVDTMDYNKESNILLMRSKFMEEGLGDTLYNKLKLTIEYTKKVAPQGKQPNIEAQHAAIFNNADADAWKKQYFWLVNPLGVNMLLYGFQNVLYKASSQALSQ